MQYVTKQDSGKSFFIVCFNQQLASFDSMQEMLFYWFKESFWYCLQAGNIVKERYPNDLRYLCESGKVVRFPEVDRSISVYSKSYIEFKDADGLSIHYDFIISEIKKRVVEFHNRTKYKKQYGSTCGYKKHYRSKSRSYVQAIKHFHWNFPEEGEVPVRGRRGDSYLILRAECSFYNDSTIQRSWKKFRKTQWK